MPSLKMMLVGGMALAGTACATEPAEPQLRNTGTFYVTERTRHQDAIASAAVFGRIATSEAFEPTATIGDCRYFDERISGGISEGAAMIRGAGAPVLVEPSSYINGTVYDANVSTELQEPGAQIVVELTSLGMAVEAVAPATLSGVSLPDAVSTTAPVTVGWHPGASDEVVVALSMESYGNLETISCRTADTGSFTIPGELLAMLDDRGARATLWVVRRNAGTTASVENDLQLTVFVESHVFRSVTVN